MTEVENFETGIQIKKKKSSRGSFIGINNCEKCHKRRPKAKVKLGELHIFMCETCIENTEKKFELDHVEMNDGSCIFQLCFEPLNQHLKPVIFICRDQEEMLEWKRALTEIVENEIESSKNFYIQEYLTGWLYKDRQRVWVVYDRNNGVLYWDTKMRTLERNKDGLLKKFKQHLILIWYKVLGNTLLAKKTKSRSFFKKKSQVSSSVRSLANSDNVQTEELVFDRRSEECVSSPVYVRSSLEDRKGSSAFFGYSAVSQVIDNGLEDSPPDPFISKSTECNRINAINPHPFTATNPDISSDYGYMMNLEEEPILNRSKKISKCIYGGMPARHRIEKNDDYSK